MAVTVYRPDAGASRSICCGPHVPRCHVKAGAELLRSPGRTGRGDEKNGMLQRVYGTAFADAEALEAAHRIEEARRRDHRRLGPELDLFPAPASPFSTRRGRPLQRAHRLRPRAVPAPGIPGSHHAADLRRGALPDLGSLRQLPRQHVLHPRRRTGIRREADELPEPRPDVRHADLVDRDLPLRIADFGRLHRFECSGVVSVTRVRTFARRTSSACRIRSSRNRRQHRDDVHDLPPVRFREHHRQPVHPPAGAHGR